MEAMFGGKPADAAVAPGGAAAGGAVSAEYNLGMLYQNGLGGQPDFVRAVEHFERGANARDPKAMLALEKILDCVLSWVCTSSPMTTSQSVLLMVVL